MSGEEEGFPTYEGMEPPPVDYEYSNSPSKEETEEVYYVISDFQAQQSNQIDIKEGDQVKVLEQVNENWWWVELGGVAGYVPANHLSCDSSLNPGEDGWQDEEYFGNYDSLKLQLEMLHDQTRTLAYRTAIETGRNFIQNKVVLDFGCGTGILSLFLAQLGYASKVYAVDASNITKQAKKIVEHNGLTGIIEVIQSKGEWLQLPERVDLIVSEWMGTLLLCELMLESLLIVRDNYLKEDGVMWPSEAELFLVPCSAKTAHREKVEFWDDVYGFDLSPLRSMAEEEIFGRPIYNHVLDKEDCLAEATTILKLDIKTVKVEELERTDAEFNFEITKEGTFHGFGSWFEVSFGGFPSKTNPVCLSTSPYKKLTHWKQDLFKMNEHFQVYLGDIISGKICITRNRFWRRHLHVSISCAHFQDEVQSDVFFKEFRLWR